MLVQFSTSKQIPKLPALEYAIIQRVWLDSLEVIQSHKNSISIQLFPHTWLQGTVYTILSKVGTPLHESFLIICLGHWRQFVVLTCPWKLESSFLRM